MKKVFISRSTKKISSIILSFGAGVLFSFVFPYYILIMVEAVLLIAVGLLCLLQSR